MNVCSDDGTDGSGIGFGERDESADAKPNDQTFRYHSVSEDRPASSYTQCYHLRMLAGAVRGFVLAGGKSSRMGTDKALLRLDGVTLLERIARAVQEAVGSVAVVGDPLRYRAFGYPVIEDAVCDSGPLAGIQAALASSKADWNLVVACDMPGVTADGLRELVEIARNVPEGDVVVPYFEGRPQPLCALYHRRAHSAIEHALRLGRLKIMDAIAGLRIRTLPMSGEELFRNVNTPEEWSAFVPR